MQGETGDRRRFGGIGLGLYIVRQLARAQDGEVAVGDRDGGGTLMRLVLHRASQQEASPVHPPTAPAAVLPG